MYQSPFHFFDPAVFDPAVDDTELKRALGLEKRKLMAEFELAETPVIYIRGRELHRQNLIRIFDELQAPLSFQLHLQIWQSPSFLNFLETAATDAGKSWLQMQDAILDVKNRKNISGFYALAVGRYLQKCLQAPAAPHPNLKRLTRDRWLLPADEQTAFDRTLRFYMSKNSEIGGIKHRSESGGEVYMNHVYEWCSEDQLEILNDLPQYFGEIRCKMAESLNDLCVHFDRLGKSRSALAAIQRAAFIKFDDDGLRRVINSNRELLQDETRVYSAPKPLPTPEPSQQRLTGIIWAILWGVSIIWLLLRAAGCTE